MQKSTIGIIGTGNICDAYLKGAAEFPLIKITACADINTDAAQAKATKR
jgi:predicted dehydrogenase